MSEYDRLRVDVVGLIGEAVAAVPELGDDDRQRLDSLRERIEKGRFYVLVCGEYKRGKSSLINALLEEPELCPTAVNLATSVVTTIEYAADEAVTAHLGEIGSSQPVRITRDEIAGYVNHQENDKNAKQARVVEIGLPNDKLESGLTLVDTPGVGSLNAEHTAVTYLFLPNADAVLFVGDLVEPLSTQELDFLGDIAKYAKTIVVALTKLDLVSDTTVQLGAARERVAERLGRRPEDVMVVPVSSQLKLDGLRSGDPEDIEESNYAALEEELWSGIGQRSGAMQLSGGLIGLAEILDRTRGPLAVERTALREESEPKLQELRDKIADLKEQNAALGRDRAEWRTQLRERLDRAGAEVGKKLARDIDRVDAKLELEYLEDADLLADPEQIVGKVTGDLARAVADAGEQFSATADDILTDLAVETEVDLNDLPGVEPPEFDAVASLNDLQIELSTASARSRGGWFQTARAGTMGSTTGLVLGGIAATILGITAAPVLAIGALAGAGLGIRDHLRRESEVDLSKLRIAVNRNLRPVLNDNKRSARGAIDDMVRDARNEMTKALDDRIKARRDSIQEMIDSLDEAGRMTAEEAKQRQAELDTQIAQLDKLGRRAHELRVAVDGMSAGTEAPTLVDVDEG